MAKGIQTLYGKAFEYACLLAIYEKYSKYQDIIIEETEPVVTARNNYESVPVTLKADLFAAANAATRVISRLEPQLEYPGNNKPLYLTLQSDAQGIKGDVRDVLCLRKQNEWEIGFSCKHNHHAVKHSRLSASIDFGKEWFNIPCHQQYFDEVVPLFNKLKQIREDSKATALWSDIIDKSATYYIPLLKSFMDELKRIDKDNPNKIPALLINYLIGKNDFYKVITDDSHKTTRVEAINIAGTLNKQAEGHKSIVSIEKLKLPSKFYHIDFKDNSDNTIEVVCDEGWSISMRIHNASSRVEPSLKFDVNLISLPSSVHAQVEPW